MNRGQESSSGGTSPRYRNLSGRPLNRRVVMKAAAGLGATFAMGGAHDVMNRAHPPIAHAMEAEGTRAVKWDEASNRTARRDDGDGWFVLQTDFPFWAVGAGWDANIGWEPEVALQVSKDGVSWGPTWTLPPHSDGGPKPADGRVYTDLVFTNGEQFIRYKCRDAEDNAVTLSRFVLTYIDPTDGPWTSDSSTMTMMRTSDVNPDTDVPPAILTRAQWGANETYRFENGSEIWPREYQRVEHAIVHHAAANYSGDTVNAARSIYYYHAVTQGWGDIGYNYMVGIDGRIFEGRVGGANVVGGHAYQYANGSCGICLMGDFSTADPPAAAKAALAHILAYVTRDLDTYGRRDFHEVPDLPTICGHRDVVQSACPGDGLYDDLTYLRDTVAATLDNGQLDSSNSGGIVPGDMVKVITPDKAALTMRSGAGTDKPSVGSIPYGTVVEVEQGPIATPTDNWYSVIYNGVTGWVSAFYLMVTPPVTVSPSEFSYGINTRVKTSAMLRQTPSTSGTVLKTVPAGEWGFVLAGPVSANGYTWYQLRTLNYGTGWVALPGFELAPVSNPTPKYAVGTIVKATTSASIRVRPGIAQTVQGTASTGTTMTVSVPPIAVTGRTWYGVASPAFGGGWVDETQIASTGSTAPSDAIGKGVLIRATEAVNIRAGAGTNYASVGTLPTNGSGYVTDGPRVAEGYTWWYVSSGYGNGWVVENYLMRSTMSTVPTPSRGLSVGASVSVTRTQTLRRAPSVGASIIQWVTAAMTATVLEGPTVADENVWWKVRLSNGVIGWTAEGGLQKVAGPVPSKGLAVGDAIVGNRRQTIRSSPSLGATVIRWLDYGITGTIVGGPRIAEGYVWWQIKLSTGETGWTVETGLTKASSPAPSRGLAIGNAIMVTRRQTLRSSPNLNASIVRWVDNGNTGTIVGGPTIASGYVWWQIKLSTGETGWTVEDGLQKSTSAGIAIGATVKTTESLNMRSGPGTSYSVVQTLAGGTRMTVIGGPRTGSGYTWWQVRLSSGVTGWVAQDWIARV